MFGGGSGGSGFNFGTSGSNTGFSFGPSKPTGTTAASTAAGSMFGTSAPTSTSSSTLFRSNIITSKPSASKPGGFAFPGNTPATTSNTGFCIAPLQTQTTTAPAFKGLGGANCTSSSSIDKSASKGEVISQAVKDDNVPDEICKDVKAFEDYIAKQKEESNEVGKFSVRSLHKITEEINSLSVSLATICSTVTKNRAYVDKLRCAFGKQLKHAEMAQRTQNTPATLQHDNLAPIHYFIELASSFDESMQQYRQQIDELENHLHSVPQSNFLTPQDISITLVKMQETFVTLASNLHSIHLNVKQLKDQYLAYRRIVHGDQVDVFAAQKENKHKDDKNCRVRGMPPFQNLSNVAALAVASMMQPQQQRQTAPPQQNLLNPGFGATTSTNPFAPKVATGSLFGAKPGLTSTSSLFNAGAFGSSAATKPAALSAGAASTSSGNIFFGSTFNSSAGVTFGGTATNKNTFDLKLPPAGNKRNKAS